MSAALDGLVEERQGPEQGALFGQGRADSTAAGAAAAAPPAPRGPGRPPGAGNRATKERREFYLSRYSDPLEGAIAWSLPADLLAAVVRARAIAKLIGAKPLEVLEFMRRATADAMPFLHAKALDVKVDGRAVHMHFGLGDRGQAAGSGDAIDQLRARFDAARGTAEDAQLIADLADLENAANPEA